MESGVTPEAGVSPESGAWSLEALRMLEHLVWSYTGVYSLFSLESLRRLEPAVTPESGDWSHSGV